MKQVTYRIMKNGKKTNEKVVLKNLDKIEFGNGTIEFMIRQKLWYIPIRYFKFDHQKKLVYTEED